MQSNVKKIRDEINNLSLEEQLELIESLIHNIRAKKISEKGSLDWNDLYGLGKDIWGDEDAQEYLNSIREDRI